MWGVARVVLAAGLVAAQGQPPSVAPYPNAYYPDAADPYALPGAQSNQQPLNSYPSPWASGAGGWADAYAKAQAFVSQLTLAEKVNLTSGVGWELERCVGQTGSIPRLGFRSLCLQDSPVGVRDTDFNSVFPAGGTVAASWDRELMYQRGYGMGSEHRDKGVDVQLGPVVGPLGRSPEGGRNWEGFAPDPVLSGIAVGETIKGIQAAGVIACTKHFILNEQEHFRQVGEAQGYGFNITESLSSNIDDTTMHELYLWPFADAVRAGTGSIMCSYNQVNNSYACANSYVLNHLLKNELGFQGFVVSDWQAQHSGVGTALAGLDMTMPGDTEFDSGYSFWGTNLTIAVLNGTVPEWRIDDMATRIVSAWYYVGRDNTSVPINFDSWTLDTYGYQHFAPQVGYTVINEHVNVRRNHGALIRKIAAESTVLLKNTNNALPLTGTEKLTAVFGNDAGDNIWGPNGCGDRGCDNGTLGMAWGSGSANFPYLITPLAALQNEVVGNGQVFQGITDNNATAQIEALAAQVGDQPNGVGIVFVNSDSGEGYISVDGNEGDRNNLTLWRGGELLIQQVASQCNNTVVVIHSTGPVLLTGWYDNPNVTAILWAGVPGEQSGNSIADVLYGRVNPSGKLPFTMGVKRQDYGTDILYKPNGLVPQDNFGEGPFIDYRAFDKLNNTPIYEFGYGITYTNFSYSDLSIVAVPADPYTPTTGMTSAAPVLGTAGNASDYLFPSNITRIPLYVYPYLNSTNLTAASGDPYYGEPLSSFVPSGSQNGSAQPLISSGGAPGGNPSLYDVLYTVSATITNTGSRDGAEVVQLYLNLGGPNQAKVVLRNFEKVGIKAGQSVVVQMDLVRRDISNWDTASQDWVVTGYPKTVYVGASSRKLYLSAPLEATTSTSTSTASSYPMSTASSYAMSMSMSASSYEMSMPMSASSYEMSMPMSASSYEMSMPMSASSYETSMPMSAPTYGMSMGMSTTMSTAPVYTTS